MRYRKLDENGDMQFGAGSANFYVDSPDAVGQAVLTRLRLLTGEWFLDLDEGTPWGQNILGMNTAALRDRAIRGRILATQGVTGIASYSSVLQNRNFTVSVVINTQFGQTPVQATL